ncbi:hypothetical protein DRQ53_00470, partial [bacterium]
FNDLDRATMFACAQLTEMSDDVLHALPFVVAFDLCSCAYYMACFGALEVGAGGAIAVLQFIRDR